MRSMQLKAALALPDGPTNSHWHRQGDGDLSVCEHLRHLIAEITSISTFLEKLLMSA